jgi:hypothetical protein
MFYKEDETGTVYVCIYVDDGILVGDGTAINSTIEAIKVKYSN